MQCHTKPRQIHLPKFDVAHDPTSTERTIPRVERERTAMTNTLIFTSL